MIKQYAVLRTHLSSIVRSVSTAVESTTFLLMDEADRRIMTSNDNIPGFSVDLESDWTTLDAALCSRPRAIHFVLEWITSEDHEHNDWITHLHLHLPLSFAKGLLNIGVQHIYLV